ncbi:MAG: hypothetical protein LAO03_22020 [Acidobacteriia bacterium]|nr:hypothetical protein [Terriglobia bacterium]
MASKSVIHPKGVFAPLHFLSEAASTLGIPIRTAEKWVEPADFPAFVEELDARVRALADLFDSYLEEHPNALECREDPGLGRCVEMELAHTRKNLGFMDRIGKAGKKEDAGKSNEQIVRDQIRRALM